MTIFKWWWGFLSHRYYTNHLKIFALNWPISFLVQQSDFPMTGMMFTWMFIINMMFICMFILMKMSTQMFITEIMFTYINVHRDMKMIIFIIITLIIFIVKIMICSPSCESCAWTQHPMASVHVLWGRWSTDRHVLECLEPKIEKSDQWQFLTV